MPTNAIPLRLNALGLLSSAFIFSVFVNLLMLTGPLYMLQVYDRVLASRSEETLVALSILVLGLYAMMGLLDYARAQLMMRFSVRLRRRFDETVFETVLEQSATLKTRAEAAAGLRQLDVVQTAISAPIMLALFDLPWAPLFIATIFLFHPLLGWLAVVGGGTLLVVAVLNSWLTRRKVLKAQQKSQAAHLLADQTRASSEIVRAQGMGRAMIARWLHVQNDALAHSAKATSLTGGFTALTKSFRLLLQSAMLGLGAWLVLQNQLTAGAMIAGSILLGRALAPVEQTLGQWAVLQRAREGWSGLKQLLASRPRHKSTTYLPTPKAQMQFRRISAFASGAKSPTLSGINFTLEPGQVLGVIGNSGMGKTTLAKAMLGLVPAAAGEIRFGGATLDQYDPDQLGSLIGYLPQNVTLFSGTVAENIARMSTTPDEAQVFEAARRANAHEMILKLPDGYQTRLHGGDCQLSGGQKQRLALARALYGDPVLLVLDEPNSALDHTGTVALNQAIREFKSSDRSVVIMTHRPQAIAESDRIIVMEGGRIKADGPRDEVLKAMLKNANEVTRAVAQDGA